MSQSVAQGPADIESLLLPIREELPVGEFLLYEGTYDKIREARRFDDPDLPRGVWQHDLKSADWGLVEGLCVEALENRSKDLQIAGWFCEAAMHRRGFVGLTEGLEVILRLCEAFWVDIHPRLEEDAEFRCAPFHWLNEKLAPEVFGVPVAIPDGERALAVSWRDRKRALWLENSKGKMPEGGGGGAKGPSGVAREEFERRVARTSSQYFLDQSASLERSIGLIRDLESLLDRELRERSPSLVRLRENLSEIHGWTRTILRSVTPPDPEPAMDEPEDSGMKLPEEAALPTEPVAPPSVRGGEAVSGPFQGRDDAYRRIEAAAHYLRSVEPHSPAPYMVLRAVAWGGKPLNELLQELRRLGLDLETLSSFLGLNEEDGM